MRKEAVFAHLFFIHEGILGVEVIDHALQFADGRGAIDAVPDQVAGVEVGADVIAAVFAQANQGLGVGNCPAGMHFNGNAHAVLLGKLGKSRQ